MAKKYILNLETGKIELHFAKAEYLSLPEEDKKKIKRHFLYSKRAQSWISRAKEPNLHWAIETAHELGFTEEERFGQRLTFAEQMRLKAQRAEARAERYDIYASNAVKRAETLQAEFKKFRNDIAFLTQPVLSGHSGSQSFGRRRQQIIERYGKGFEEYRKSEYFQRRAEIARATARQDKMKDRAYLCRKIEECQKSIQHLTKNAAELEKVLQDIENGRTVEKYNPEQLLTDTLERLEVKIDEQAYYQNALDELGGVVYSRENIKVGYIVRIRGYEYEVLKANPKTVQVRCISGGAKGFVPTYTYPEIQEVIRAVEVKPKQETEEHPYHEGEILVRWAIGGKRIIRAYEIIKRTPKTIQIQQIQVQDGKPVPGAFVPGSKPQRKKPTIRAYTNQWFVADEHDWGLDKYTG